MQQVLIVRDERYARHLEGVPHLESPKRFKAMNSVLDDPSLQGRWREVGAREASREELAWVHKPEYIDRVAQQRGKTADLL
jgi:acetoin utilization deacetylase AcuC-like enzyme